MSVLKNKRHISSLEFIRHYGIFYRYCREAFYKVPNRRQMYICTELTRLLNEVYTNIMNLSDVIFAKTKEKILMKQQCLNNALNGIYDMQKPFLIYWNIQHTPFDKMCNVCDYLHREIVLLDGIMNKEKENKDNIKYRKLVVLDWNKINQTKFLRNMCNLHRYTHGKVIRASGKFNNCDTALLISLADDAFFNVITANVCFPTNKEEYEIRKNKIDKAIRALNHMQIPLMSFFNIMQYSNRIQEEWTKMIVDEIKMLRGLQKSDKQRFGNLN